MRRIAKKQKVTGCESAEFPRLLKAPPVNAPPPHPVLRLQQQAGNEAVRQILHPDTKHSQVEITSPEHPAEREAQEITDRIMRTPSEKDRRMPPNARRAADGSPTTIRPGILDGAMRSSGRPLDSTVRDFFEPRFGKSLEHVRVHTGSDAAKSARFFNANAYATGDHIVFDAGKYAPESGEGRRLIAHELSHVLQEGFDVGPLIRRSPGPTPAPPPAQPEMIHDNTRDENRWRVLVDNAVRTQFGLGGAGVEAANVNYLDQSQFGSVFSTADLEEKLFTIFLDFGQTNGTLGQILDFNHQPFLYAGVTPTTMDQIREFVKQGISRGFFEGQTRELDVTTGQRFPVFRVTARELVAAFVAGITDISVPRARRKITMRLSQGTAEVDTLVHEVCHFYVSDAYRNMVNARKDKDEFIGFPRISQILFEGVAEYFKREVMVANAATFGPVTKAYQPEVEQVHRLVITLGENSLRAAYFGGDAKQIKRLAFAVDQYKSMPLELLLPGFVLDMDISDASKRP